LYKIAFTSAIFYFIIDLGGNMQNIKQMVKKQENNMSNEFYKNMKDEAFKNIVNKTDLPHEELLKYTSRINDCAEELKNCATCKGLKGCNNELKGYRNTPIKNEDGLSFTFVICPYKEKELKNNQYKENINLFDVPENLKNAKIKDIRLDDKSRVEVIKYIDAYYKNYETNRLKGLYLHGSFGCGKTYMVAALLNEFAKSNIKSAIIYFPEFLRTLKASFNNDATTNTNEKYEYIKHIPLLLIDDIGAENLTAWGRDEILGTLLQYRMEQSLPTFFTSNLSLEELEIHLSLTGQKLEKVKARRIIERIKCLSNELEVIGANRR